MRHSETVCDRSIKFLCQHHRRAVNVRIEVKNQNSSATLTVLCVEKWLADDDDNANQNEFSIRLFEIELVQLDSCDKCKANIAARRFCWQAKCCREWIKTFILTHTAGQARVEKERKAWPEVVAFVLTRGKRSLKKLANKSSKGGVVWMKGEDASNHNSKTSD